MIAKPDKCCAVGTYECAVPMPIGGIIRDVDLCIAPLVAALNAANIPTAGCCCGHGKRFGSILLGDERVLLVCTEAMDAEISAWWAHK